jgi:hypothetical protein
VPMLPPMKMSTWGSSLVFCAYMPSAMQLQTWRFRVWEKEDQAKTQRMEGNALTILSMSHHIPQRIFMRLVHGLREYGDYFLLKKDYTKMYGFSCFHKCTNSMRLLAYGDLADTSDNHLCMSESEATEVIYKFCRRWWQCLEQPIWEHHMKLTHLESWQRIQREYLLTYIENRRTASLERVV